jgi:hypothetical protein
MAIHQPLLSIGILIMLKTYKPSYVKIITKQTLLILVAVIIAFSSVTAGFLYTHRDMFANAESCGDVFDPLSQGLLDRINANKSVYIQVQNEKGVPWEMLAAIHFRELNAYTYNPSNGQGIYQLYSYTQDHPDSFPSTQPNPVSQKEFLRQTRLAADIIQEKAENVPATTTIQPRKLRANEDNINLIKSTLFSYNGRASSYAKQAATYGFSSTIQPYEGSPYVMSKFDCKRKSMGLISTDGGNTFSGNDTRMGAFTLYARLKGNSYWNQLQVGNIPGCKQATGTTLSCVWRLYNPGKKNYIYTTSYDERNAYIAMGYLYQDISFFGRNRSAVKINGQIPVYKVTDGTGGTLLTVNTAEYNALKAAGWDDNGISFYADPAGTNTGYPVYRLYSSATGAHVWTGNSDERKTFKSQGFADEGVAFNRISPIRQESPAPVGQYVVYRFGNMPENRHFWTTDIYERDRMIREGYRYEGVAWRASATATSIPVYRLYSSSMKKHLFTTDGYEKNVLDKTSSWKYEGIAWYSNPVKTGAPVYRLYAAHNAEHFFTTDTYERDKLSKSKVFRYEGTAWRQP